MKTSPILKNKAHHFVILTVVFWTVIGLIGFSHPSVLAQDIVDNTARPGKAIVVPDQFLRRWDPVTIFFNSNKGSAGTAENNPEKFVTLSPNHPGAYTWLDKKTLQFRPAEPWPPLTRFRWQVGRQASTLSTLVSAPIRTFPSNNASDLRPVESISLTFPAPVNPITLKEMLTIELRPSPGILSPKTSGEQATWLGKNDFDIKSVERQHRAEEATYVVNLLNPIAENTHATVHLRLSLNDTSAETSTNAEQSFFRLPFSTAQPFTVSQLGCPAQRYPIAPSGSRYPEQQAIQCNGGNRQIQIHFSSRLSEVNPISARNLIHISPSVENVSYQSYGNILTVSGNFQNDQLYQINLEPTEIQDHSGRQLTLTQGSELFLFYPVQNSFLQTQVGSAIVERHGPQMIPLLGRGHERIDLRIHPVNPLDRNFWPFPKSPLVIDEEQRPEAPGERPENFTDQKRYISQPELRRHVKALGAPSVSTLVEIPLTRSGPSATFGLDLQPHLEKIVGKNKPGTYLVGMRKLDSSKERTWVRLQVTDLSLSTIHEPQRVRFVVTSLSSSDPVSNAVVTVEGSDGNIVTAQTNSRGQFDWRVNSSKRGVVRRIVVSKGNDVLVFNPNQAPDRYANNLWQSDRRAWLQWTQGRLSEYDNNGQNLCHLFTERPIYKPEESVHIKGYVRRHRQGQFSIPNLRSPRIVIDGPGDLEWIYPVTVTPSGSYYHEFNEESLPTGQFTADFRFGSGRCGSVTFSKESYRLPTFEVQMNGSARANNDQAFSVELTAQYYAGGQVIGQPIDWRVTQFPYSFTPKKQEGFFYSSDARFSQNTNFKSTAAIQETATTDNTGAASITIDPTIEATAQARRYIIEATVTGADDQTVTNTFQALALPPFVLGLNVPRYTQDDDSIPAKILVADSLGELIAGQSVDIKMRHRQWHSHLQLGDFSQGEAKYVTEIVDSLVYENSLESTADITEIDLPISEAGVYIVEIEARDKLGRSQTVQVDLFAGGDEPVTWSQQASQVFKVTTNKKEFEPGETAIIILESPFQTARALAIVEQPNGVNRYDWVSIRGGKAEYKVDVQQRDLPRLPVHFLLMRGRVSDQLQGNLDLGKPQTLAASTYIEVSRVDNQVTMELEYPEKVQPGDEITVDIALKDRHGDPLTGEVTLWLVDQSVLALGKEQEIDLLPDFIRHRDSYTSLRDSRNQVLGIFPYQEQPGGGEGQRARLASDLLDKVTVRKNFSPVPYFNPNITVGRDGKQQVTITIPDNLTNFKVRAKVVSGRDKFGFHKGELSVRLPVIVQPSLPRFVRPGDSFNAIAIGRVVEGDSGDGRAQIAVDGLSNLADDNIDFQWQTDTPQRIEFPLQVPNPQYNSDGELERNNVSVTVAVERESDNARDAFKIDIPIRPDRKAVRQQSLHTLAPGEEFNFDAIGVPLRDGGLQRSLIVSDQTALLRMSAGLNYLLDYPHGCTEQRLSRARAQLASQKFSSLINLSASDNNTRDKVIDDTLQWIDQVITDGGLVSYWPGSSSYVSLTAWTLLFFTEARQAGYAVNQAHWDRLVSALRQSLRSDYTGYILGESYAERTWALLALTMAGENTSAYAAELARRSDFLNLESLSQVIVALNQNDSDANEQMRELYDRMWSQIVFRLFQGREVYGGLQQTATSSNALILPSETRAIAQVLRATSLAPAAIKEQMPEGRRQNLIDAIVTLGQGDGWGSTNANAAALLSLSEVLTSDDDGREIAFSLTRNNASQSVQLESHLFATNELSNTAITISNPLNNTDALSILNDTRYMPIELGSHVSALANGFVLKRELLEIQGTDQPPKRIPLDQTGTDITFSVGSIIEEHIELVVPNDSNHVAVVIPLAAGVEALNPNLATAPPEATPNEQNTGNASYQAFYDDQLAYFFDSLPRGTYHFYFRTRATIPGEFIQPPAFAEMMYNEAINGNSHGARIIINKIIEQ